MSGCRVCPATDVGVESGPTIRVRCAAGRCGDRYGGRHGTPILERHDSRAAPAASPARGCWAVWLTEIHRIWLCKGVFLRNMSMIYMSLIKNLSSYFYLFYSHLYDQISIKHSAIVFLVRCFIYFCYALFRFLCSTECCDRFWSTTSSD